MTIPDEHRRLPAETASRVLATGSTFRAFEPRNTVRCTDDPVFRSQTARDIACLLDVDPDVVSWTTNSAPIIIGAERIQHDLTVRYADRTEFLVAVDDDNHPSDGLVASARQSGFEVRTLAAGDIAGDRLENSRELLRYAKWTVALGDRVRLLAALEQEGSLPLAECMSVMRSGRDPIAAIAALCLRRFVELDLDSGRIGPQTRVAPFKG